ncbi:MAG: hypothetical protein ACFFD2_11750 [Promethearchaeota archaeon]
MQAVFYSFRNIDSVGTVILLFLLLFISLIIGWLSGRHVKSLDGFLYSPGEMRSWEFGFSETAYMIAVGTTLILLSSLAFQYGSFFLIVVTVSWLLSLFVYAKIALKGDLIEFFRKKGAHLGEYVIGGNEEIKLTKKILLGIISIIIGVTFWLYFVTEILALKVLLSGLSPSSNVVNILGAALLLMVLYTTIGGYKGTFRTDIFQTSFFLFAIAVAVIYGLIKINSFTFAPFMKYGVWESLGVLISYSVIGIAALITGLDIWARMRASEGGELKEGERGLKWSIIALLPFILICFLGFMYSSANLGTDPNSVVPSVVGALSIPLGLVFVFLLMLSISTADTSLITTSQAMEPILPKCFRSLIGIRIFIIIISVIGLLAALAIPIPRTIQTIMLTISFPVALTPIVLIRRFSKKRRVGPVSSIFAVVGSLLFGLGFCILNIEYAYYSAALILVSAFSLYFIGYLFGKVLRALNLIS